METFNILGFIGALVIGVVLGITGGGGSIFTVPILVYLLGVMPILDCRFQWKMIFDKPHTRTTVARKANILSCLYILMTKHLKQILNLNISHITQ